MSIGILATKVGMTQIFTQEGVRIPVTVLEMKDNNIIQKRSEEKDGYTALQIGYGAKSQNKVTKPRAGHFKASGITPTHTLKEFRCTAEEAEKYNVGDKLAIGVLAGVRSVDVAGISKGKGFAGVMKKHNFKGFRATHGTHEYFRHGGSIGCRAVPGKVFKGKKMPGQMGNQTAVVVNQNVIEVNEERGLLLVRGNVPGANGAIVTVQASGHAPRRIPGLQVVGEIRSKNPMKASKAGG